MSERKYLFNTLENNLKYVFNSDNYNIGTYFQTIVFALLSPFILPIFFILGYSSNLRYARIHNKKAPKFTNYSSLLKTSEGLFISYLPPLFLIGLGLVSYLLISPMAISLIPIGLYMFPAIGIQYSEKEDYQETYSKELVEILISNSYLRAYLKYMFINGIMLFILAFLSILTVGVFFILLLPIYIYWKSVYWGSFYSEFK